MLTLKLRYLVLGLAAALLTACGGGGGGGGGGSTTQPSLNDAAVPSSFNWATTQNLGDIKVTVKRASGAALGTVQVWVSNVQDTDPQDASVKLAEPMRGTRLASALATNTSGSSGQADLGGLSLPSATTAVLVEVLDPTNTPGGRVAYQRVTPAQLSAGVTLTIPAP